MLHRHILATIIILLLVSPLRGAEYYYEFNANCQKAYEHYMALRFTEGNNTINAEIKAHPQNLMAVYISNYADCMLLLFNGDPRDYDKYYHHLAKRQELLSKGSAASPWYRLTKAALYMQWAFVHVRMGENFKAATTFRKSYLLLKENDRLFPDFDYNDIFLGVEEAVAGTVPDDYKWIAAIFGMKGDVKKGVAKLDAFVRKHTIQEPLYYDALLFNTYLKFYLMSQQEEVWRTVNSATFPVKNNLLFSFVKANIALNYRKAEEALITIRQMQQIQGYYSIPAFDYEMGSALVHKADDNAMFYMQRFVANYKGNLFVKDAYYKMACMQYAEGHLKEAASYRQKIAGAGSTDVDADRRAERFAKEDMWPNLVLLKASWMIDGGYYTKALALLGNYKEADFSSIPEAAEYNLRMGRIYDELGDDNKALQYYARAMYVGGARKEYFAARASLQAAFIYERKGNRQQAIHYFNQCLEMPVQDYKNAIKQQAKAGINRLNIK